LNYRHHFHAGNFADVMKHALLVMLARAMQRKPRGILFVDTHAGRGTYDLDRAARGDTLPRKPEHEDGIGRLRGAAGPPPGLAEYLDLVRAFATERGPSFYPGSPSLLRLLAREQDRLALCELQPQEFRSLKAAFASQRHVSTHEMDGYVALRAMLPPPEKRALVLIDPPYEAASEWDRLAAALCEGLGRFPAGVYAAWYPLTDRANPGDFFSRVATLATPVLDLELTVDPASKSLKGCGLLIANPPWRFDREAAPVLKYLAGLLAKSANAKARVRWIVPE
jgi:23S rRNA (adenine2030-N6)-methyltransferase